MELRARAQLAFRPNPATMSLNDVLDDGQAQTGAPRVSGARLVDTIEAFKYPVEML